MRVLKASIFTIFILHNFCVVSLLFAAEKDDTKKDGVYGNVAVDETLLKMFQVPGVKAKHEDCVKRNAKFTENVPTCVWKEISDDQRKAVQAIYAAEAKANKSNAGSNSRAPASDKGDTTLTGKVLPAKTDYSSDPAVQALSEYYGKKLNEILDPSQALTLEEQKAGKILSTDHKKFIDLYKSELGKTIISAFTSYCLDTKDDTCHSGDPYCLIAKKDEDRKKDREENLKLLKSNGLDLNSKSNQSKKWNNCIVSVPKVCEIKLATTAAAASENEEYSKQRACIIVDYVKAARKSIMVADEQKKFYDDLAKANGTGGGIAENFQAITDENKTSADSILAITSKDVEDNLKKTTKDNLAEFDACLDKSKNINEELCKKFLNTKTDVNSNSITELGLRQNAKEEALKEELNSSNAKVVSYLKEEGFEEKEIKSITEDKTSLEKIKTQILARYAAEKDAIIKEMARRIDSKTSSEDGKLDTVTNKSKLDTIRSAISNKSSELANLVQFNNIVSSYLSIDTGNKKIERNTASLYAEVKTMNKDEAKILGERIKDAKLVEKKNNADLDVDTINESFLNYDELEKKKKP